MRKITMWFIATAAAMVLLFTYRTSTMGTLRPASAPALTGGDAPGIVAAPTPRPAASRPPDNGNQPALRPSVAPSSPATAVPSAGTVSTSGSDLVVNGSSVSTQFGPVQVQAHISGNRIIDVTALRAPDGMSQQLSAYAVPRLRSQALAAQSANIDVVSGATQTSEGYRSSLQAALDIAHFTANR